MIPKRPKDGSSHISKPALPKSTLSLWEQRPLASGCPRKMGQEKGEKFMSYLNSVTIIGFVGADPEQRQARNNNGAKTTQTIPHHGEDRSHTLLPSTPSPTKPH